MTEIEATMLKLKWALRDVVILLVLLTVAGLLIG